MSRALSVDLRMRVLAAVEAGAGDRETAERFAVSAASVKPLALAREKGTPPLGGKRRSGQIEAVAGLIRVLLERGDAFGYGTIQRFFRRHALTRKNRPRTPASRTARTSLGSAAPGSGAERSRS